MIQDPLVWIIDDDDISKYVMKRYFKKLDTDRIIDFPDSTQPLQLLKENSSSLTELPDFIFLDLHMPILSGFDFIVELQNLTPKIDKKISIVMLTSSMSTEDIDKAKSFPEITDYFVKPIKQSDLADLMGMELKF